MKPKGYKIVGLSARILVLGLGSVACSPLATPTFFVPPTESASLPPAAIASREPGSPAGAIAIPSVVVPSPTPPCIDGLSYLQDLTIPDGTNVQPGQYIDKQWQVKNSGTCNWDQRYRLKLISGAAMGADLLLPLYPARAGAEATIEIRFTAPQSAGLYECHWQAVGPEGQPFGDAFYMQVAVTP